MLDKLSRLAWLRSYLLNRKQRMVIKGVESEALVGDIEVLQGSELGPTVFNLYIKL